MGGIFLGHSLGMTHEIIYFVRITLPFTGGSEAVLYVPPGASH